MYTSLLQAPADVQEKSHAALHLRNAIRCCVEAKYKRGNSPEYRATSKLSRFDSAVFPKRARREHFVLLP